MCVRACVHMCASLCDSKNIISRRCMLIVPHTVRVSNPSRFTLARSLSPCLPLSLSPSPSLPTSPFFHPSFPFPYFSSPYDISAVLKQLLSALPHVHISAIGFYQGSLSFWLLQIEAATLQKTSAPLRRNFGFRTIQPQSAINENLLRVRLSQ